MPAQGAPEWIRPWRHQLYGTTPGNTLSVRGRRPGDPASVIGYFNEVPAHRVSWDRKDCYIIRREAFKSLIYEAREDGSCVSVSYTPLENQKLRLKI